MTEKCREFEALIDWLNCGILLFDVRGRCLLANKEAQRVLEPVRMGIENSSTLPTPSIRSYSLGRVSGLPVGSTRNTLYLWIRSGKVRHPQTKMSPTKWLWSDKDIERLKAFKAAHPWQRRDSR